MIVLISVAVSAFVDNIPYTIAMLPVAELMAIRLAAEPLLFIFALVISASLGGNITPIGASANVTAVVGLIQVRFPELLHQPIPIESPKGLAAQLAVNEAIEKTGRPAHEVGVFFITPCPAKTTAVHQPEGGSSRVSGTISITEIYGVLHHAVQAAAGPAIRVAIGEEFGLQPGSVVTGQLVSALRMLGFDTVFDTDFTADLTIIEEGHEFIDRLTKQGKLPMITSCSPGWIKYIEHNYPDYLDHLSTCKSPQQMFGALAKTYYSRRRNLNPEDVFVVSVMPCTAKKFEAARPEMTSSGHRDVDVVLTTRELARMIKLAGIRWSALPESEYDDPLGISTGAGVIFGATGGVMEAALRTVYEVVTGEELGDINFTAVRGMQGIKEAEVALRQSHHNPAVTRLYEEFLRRPLSHTSHELLHTHYKPRK